MDDAKAHAAALETFIRLTESDRQHQDTSTVDQGEIRAALARTAARKKPGGDRLQPHDGPNEESLGGQGVSPRGHGDGPPESAPEVGRERCAACAAEVTDRQAPGIGTGRPSVDR
jgi:hypothetical protein